MLLYLLRLWMKSYGVSIQMKPLQQYFHMVLFLFQHFTTRNLEILLNFYFRPLVWVKGKIEEVSKDKQENRTVFLL